MLKLGQLYLDGGVWHGRRLIDQRWINASVTRHATFGPNHDYGYGWHLHAFRVDGHDYRGYAAEGNGGQFVIVVPELDMVVAITAGNYGKFPVWYPLQQLVTDYVIPAALQRDVAGSRPVPVKVASAVKKRPVPHPGSTREAMPSLVPPPMAEVAEAGRRTLP